MQAQDKKVISIVVLAIALVQFSIVGIRYIQSASSLKNPLIPGALLEGIRNYSFAMMGCYLVAAILAAISLKKQKFFWPLVICAVLILAGVAFFTIYIQDYFITRSVS